MYKSTVQRKSNLKKPSVAASDDESHRRRPCYQYLQEKQRKLLAEHSTRKINNQLDALREILFYQRNEPKSNKNSRKISERIDWNQLEEEFNEHNNNSDGEEMIDNKYVRVSRSEKKDDQQHQKIRSKSLYSQPNDIRSMNNVSFMSDISKTDRKSNGNQLRKLLDRLWSELIELESMTGYKPSRNDLSSKTSNAALATALIALTGHVKQCTPNLNIKQEINNLKDQVSVMIKNQLDFQQKIESQMTTLQTMLQTVCQLVNNEIIPNKKSGTRDQINESRQDWLTNAQRPYVIPKDTYNAMDELLMITRRMNNATPMDSNLYRHSTFTGSRPISASSTNGTNGNGFPEHVQQSKNQGLHSFILSPINAPSLSNMFELRFPNDNPTFNIPRNGIDETITVDETILEKIFQERRRLVQQMAQLNKQHEMTQEELANLESKTV